VTKGPRVTLHWVTRYPALRDTLIFLAFCAFTSILTWPYVTRMRDAVVDPGDPYMVSWVLWWDYHQTFSDPLNLFHSNLFYPYRYTLAFGEHSYGIALLCFPLFMLGLRPLTVHAVAMFFAFAATGYGAFRLARTLTGSYGVAWVAGIIFGFGPFRFHYMSHLLYLFAAWIPLLFEALVLFARKPNGRRAIWLGVAFFMTGLSTVSWLIFSLLPFALCTIVLATRYKLWRNIAFWLKYGSALAIGGLALTPFTVPYLFVSRLYGFKRSVDEVKGFSAVPSHWLSVEDRNKLWSGLGRGLSDGGRFKLFPGLLPLLLSLAAIIPQRVRSNTTTVHPHSAEKTKWIRRLDIAILVTLILSGMAIGFDRTDLWHGVFKTITSERALTLLALAIVARLCLAYPGWWRTGENQNLVQTIKSERYSDAFLIGLILFVVGFCYSLGWNFFLYRIQYDLFFPFRSMRVPPRGAMIAYVGLSILAGLGCQRLAHERWSVRRRAVYLVVCTLLLLEFNAAPLHFIRGAVFPDGVTQRLKDTSMRAGIVVLPAGPDFNNEYILRAADHRKPLIVGTASFVPPYAEQIEALTNKGPITNEFLDLIERIPASYVVVHNALIAPDRTDDYNAMLKRATLSGRLTFINRFDGKDDLYAVTSTEPGVQSEAPVPDEISGNPLTLSQSKTH